MPRPLLVQGRRIAEPTLLLTPGLTANPRNDDASPVAYWVRDRLAPWMAQQRDEGHRVRVLDYGCGRGRDVRFYRQVVPRRPTLAAYGFDAYLRTTKPEAHAPYDLVTCVNVLNTVPTWELRLEVMERLHELVADDGVLVLTATSLQWLSRRTQRSGLYARKGLRDAMPWGDGFFFPRGVSREGQVTGFFQHGFSTDELRWLAACSGFRLWKKLPWPTKAFSSRGNVVFGIFQKRTPPTEPRVRARQATKKGKRPSPTRKPRTRYVGSGEA